MRITIVTPLFPPDASKSATYVKELAKRLDIKNDVTVVHYGRLPECVPGVTIISIPKRLLIVRRLWKMFVALHTEFKKTDLILLQNGPSVELPAILASVLSQKKFLYVISDADAQRKSEGNLVQKIILHVLSYRQTKRAEVTTISELLPPMLHPLQTPAPRSISKHDDAWQAHITDLVPNQTP